MPFVNIKITKENGPTKEQKEELIAGVTEVLVKVLHKNKASTVVIIEEIDTDNYGLGGQSITQVCKANS
ncbi:2-hydroxymuconate tautomerase family protein [Helicobacter acinonychis]|uniref:2-hydroxymuconate tautomerase family protein n=1 Tax=Helicobacter acinonychis TaxID=212 RepID=UPI00349FA6B6